MQNPHWAAPVSRNACWSGWSRSPAASPSTVVTVVPSASTASIRHESTLRPSTRTVHAPHSPTRQHSFVPVRPRSSRSTSRSVWCGSDVDRRDRPLTVKARAPARRHRRTAAASASRSIATPTARRPRTWSIASRYSGLARIERRRRARPDEQRLEPLHLRAVRRGPGPRARPSRRRRGPVAGRGCRTRCRVTPSSSTAQASVTDARSWPRRRVRRTWTLPMRTRRARQLDRRDELAAGERRDTRPDEAHRRPGRSGPRPGRPPRPVPRKRAAPGRCRPPARRCRCCPPASPGSGSGPTRRRPPPRPAPGSRAGSARRRRCRSSPSARRSSAPPSPSSPDLRVELLDPL